MTKYPYFDFINPGRMVILRKAMVEMCNMDIAIAYVITQIKMWEEGAQDHEKDQWLENTNKYWAEKFCCTPQDLEKANKYIKKNKVFDITTLEEEEEIKTMYRVCPDKWDRWCKKHLLGEE